jgi:hypothetical protein
MSYFWNQEAILKSNSIPTSYYQSGKRVPPIECEQGFNYLGKQFNFNMECEQIKVEILSEIDEYLQKIDLFPMNPFSKIRIIQNYVYSKLRWRFSIYPFSETCMDKEKY